MSEAAYGVKRIGPIRGVIIGLAVLLELPALLYLVAAVLNWDWQPLVVALVVGTVSNVMLYAAVPARYRD